MNNKIQLSIIVIIIFLAIGTTISILIETEKITLEQQRTDCYNQVGRINITFEYLEDGFYHAKTNETIVCAHGRANKTGLKETLPFPWVFGIKIEEI